MNACVFWLCTAELWLLQVAVHALASDLSASPVLQYEHHMLDESHTSSNKLYPVLKNSPQACEQPAEPPEVVIISHAIRQRHV